MNTKRWGRVPRELARKTLADVGELTGVQSVVLFSSDGFELASHSADAATSARLAAIGSSLAALGSAISGEAGMRDFERTTIESEDGTVIIMRVDGSDAMSMAVVAGPKAMLGQLLWATRQCCEELGKIMAE